MLENLLIYLFGAWITITPPMHLITDSTQVLLAEFNTSVQTANLLDIANYELIDQNGNSVPFYSSEFLTILDGDSVLYTTLVAFEVKKLIYRNSYTFYARNLRKRVEGTLLPMQECFIWNNGFAPNLETKPKLIIIE